MAHPEQQQFCAGTKALFPEFFRSTTVLDVGSLDINGSNRALFEDCAYIGLDVGEGPGVDVVCPAHELDYPTGHFDVVISTECFEHDRHYPESFRNIVRLLRPGGLFLFTCASTGRPEHGTRRSDPSSSPLTSSLDGWQDYYKNLTAEDVRAAFGQPVTALFSEFSFQYNPNPGDLYFWGIRR